MFLDKAVTVITELVWLLSGNKLSGPRDCGGGGGGALAEDSSLCVFSFFSKPIPMATQRSDQTEDCFLGPQDHGVMGSTLWGVAPAGNTSPVLTQCF